MPAPTEQPNTVSGSSTAGGLPSARVAVDVAARTHPGLVREINEDAHAVLRIGRFVERLASTLSEAELPAHAEDCAYLMMVADGLGGHEAGEVASHSALASLIRMMLRAPQWALKLDDPATRESEVRSLLDRMRAYLRTMHSAIREHASADARLAGMGTTFTSCYSVGADLFVLHVGDSKACLFRDGRLTRITHDHTVAQDYADRGYIAQEDVAEHRMHHVLTRAVGGPEERLEGDIHVHRLMHGDRVLLCSDGLTDMVKDREIEEQFASHPTSEAACEALLALALKRGGSDNITLIVAGYTIA